VKEGKLLSGTRVLPHRGERGSFPASCWKEGDVGERAAGEVTAVAVRRQRKKSAYILSRERKKS